MFKEAHILTTFLELPVILDLGIRRWGIHRTGNSLSRNLPLGPGGQQRPAGGGGGGQRRATAGGGHGPTRASTDNSGPAEHFQKH